MEQRNLDKKIKIIWLAPTAGTIVLIWIVLSVAYYAMQTQFGFLSDLPKPLGIALILVALLLLIGLPSYLWCQLTYINFTYALTDTELIIREGVFTRKRTVIPYGRIQNINTQRTFLERILGLATITIETAGSNPGVAEGIIPGISNRDALMKELLDKVEKTKRSSGTGEEKKEESEELLKQILAELKALREEMRKSEEKASEKFAAMHESAKEKVAIEPGEIKEAEGILEKQIEKYMKKSKKKRR